MWQFKDKKDLLAVAFIDAETYIHSVRSLRGLILTSDISRSVQLLQYQVKRAGSQIGVASQRKQSDGRLFCSLGIKTKSCFN